MRTNDIIEICVVNGRSNDVCLSTADINKERNIDKLLNNNNNNNNNNVTMGVNKNDNLNHILLDRSNFMGQSSGQSKLQNKTMESDLYGSLPTLSTGITASSKGVPLPKISSTSSKKNSTFNIFESCTKDAPIARLCRIRKFPSSPFYGFYLYGDRKKLGRVFVSSVNKNSSAALCGLRQGDHIIEVNGVDIQTLTYETILNKIKLHMERQDLELLVMDKKSLRWYRQHNYPITSQTLPTIVHIEPHLNDINSEIEHSEILNANKKRNNLLDRRLSAVNL